MLTNYLRRALPVAFVLAIAAPALAGNAPQDQLAPSKTAVHLAAVEAPAQAAEQPAAQASVPGAASAAEGAESTVERATDFTYLFHRPGKSATRMIVLLHGSGGNEKSLMALAEKIAPDAILLGVRGRVRQAGVNRWYRRLTATSFDQQDVKAEAEAFAAFLSAAAAKYRLDLDQAVFLGYSNGANLIGALSLLHPNLIHRAVLLRAMPVLKQAPEARLGEADILTIGGRSDATYGPFAPQLETLLRSRGARVESHMIDSGHAIGDEDARLVREWLTLADTETLADAAK